VALLKCAKFVYVPLRKMQFDFPDQGHQPRVQKAAPWTRDGCFITGAHGLRAVGKFSHFLGHFSADKNFPPAMFGRLIMLLPHGEESAAGDG